MFKEKGDLKIGLMWALSKILCSNKKACDQEVILATNKNLQLGLLNRL